MPNEAFKFQLPSKLKRELRARSLSKGVSISDIIREALWEYILKGKEAKP
jgi:hypothetical protein